MSLPISALVNSLESFPDQHHQVPQSVSNGSGLSFVKLFDRDYPVWKSKISPFPWDEAQRDFLDILHKLIYAISLRDNLHVAKLKSADDHPVLRILDVGYGTGHWAIEMSERYPNANITGIDLVPFLVPTYADAIRTVSPVDFTDDIWPIEPASQNLIHLALLCGSVRDWRKMYRTAFKYLQPAVGQIEHIEIDWTPRSGSGPYPPQGRATQKWWDLIRTASERSDAPLACPEDAEQMLQEAGFVDISRVKICIPFAQNPYDLRDYAISNWFRCAMGFALPRHRHAWAALSLRLLTAQLGMREEEGWRLCDEVVKEVNTKDTPLCCYLNVYTARRPVRLPGQQ